MYAMKPSRPIAASRRRAATASKPVTGAALSTSKLYSPSSLPILQHFEAGLAALLIHIAVQLQYSPDELLSDLIKLRSARITTMHRLQMLRLASLSSIGLSVLVEQLLADWISTSSAGAGASRRVHSTPMQAVSPLDLDQPYAQAPAVSVDPEHWTAADTVQWLQSLNLPLTGDALGALALPGPALALLTEEQVSMLVADADVGSAVFQAFHRTLGRGNQPQTASDLQKRGSTTAVRAVNLEHSKTPRSLAASRLSTGAATPRLSPLDGCSPAPSLIVKKVKKENVRFTSTTKKYFIRWITKLSFDSVLSFIARAYAGI